MSTTDQPHLPGIPDVAAVGKAIWWMILIRGILAVLFGILVFVFSPDVTLVALAILFAVYSIVDGVMEISHALRIRARAKGWGWLFAAGVLGILAGVAAALFPALAGFFGALLVVYLIGFWSIFSGIAGFPAAHAMVGGGRKTGAYLAAVLSVLFGLALVVIATVNPGGAVSALVWTIGAYALIVGVVLIILAIGARATAKRVLAAR